MKRIPAESERYRRLLWDHGPFVLTTAQLLATWLGVNAVWGLTSPKDTLVSGWERGVAPLHAWVVASAAILSATLIPALARGGKARALLPAVLLAYLAGVLLSRGVIATLTPGNVVVERSLMMMVAAPILAVLALMRVSLKSFPLRFGQWNRRGALFGDSNGTTWERRLGWSMLVVILPIALLMQGSRGFSLLTSGAFWHVLPQAALLSLVNALAEEVVFRGLLQPPLVERHGPSRGIWLQGAFFGIHHWGSAPSIIAGLAMFPILTFLGYVWGKATHETDGLGWSVSFHAALGVAYFSAFP